MASSVFVWNNNKADIRDGNEYKIRKWLVLKFHGSSHLPNHTTVGKPRTDSVPPTMQSQIPKSRDITLFFFRHDVLQVSGHAMFTSSPHVFLLNIFINKTERRIHSYWIHFLNKIVTWLTREYVYLWYRLLEINVGTRDTAADEML